MKGGLYMTYNNIPNNSNYEDDIVFSDSPNIHEVSLEECIEFSKKKKDNSSPVKKASSSTDISDEYIMISNMSQKDWEDYCKAKKRLQEYKQDIDRINSGNYGKSCYIDPEEYYRDCKNQYLFAKKTGDKQRIKAHREWLCKERGLYFRELLWAASQQINFFTLFVCCEITVVYCILNFFIGIDRFIPLFVVLLLYFVYSTFRTFFRYNKWEEIKHLFQSLFRK